MKNIKNIVRLVIVLFLQVTVVNLLDFLGVCHPYIYILPLLMMSIQRPAEIDMLAGAALGLTMDILSSTPGVHMAACVMMCYVRRKLMPLLVYDTKRQKGEISAFTIGTEQMLRLITILVIVHHTVVFLLSAWSWHMMGWTLLEILVSSLVTICILFIYNLVDVKGNER